MKLKISLNSHSSLENKQKLRFLSEKFRKNKKKFFWLLQKLRFHNNLEKNEDCTVVEYNLEKSPIHHLKKLNVQNLDIIQLSRHLNEIFSV